MRFLVDAQLPPSLAKWLRQKGHQAEHVEDVGLREAEDRVLNEHAVRVGAILVTKDRDFASTEDTPHSTGQVVWVRTGNVSNRVLFTRFEESWTDVCAFLESGSLLIELR